MGRFLEVDVPIRDSGRLSEPTAAVLEEPSPLAPGAAYTVWLERRERGDPPAFTVRERATETVAYGPTDNSIKATRACERLNAGLMVPNKSHRKAVGR